MSLMRTSARVTGLLAMCVHPAEDESRATTALAGVADRHPSQIRFATFLYRVTCCHLMTYFLCGIAAYTLLDYKTLFETEGMSALMLPTSSRWIAGGPALNVVRGGILAMALYPFRQVFLAEGRGWCMLWGLLVGLTILSTSGPSPGSIEGMIYTKIPFSRQLLGLPEVILQTCAFSWLLVAWHRKPHRAWNVTMGLLSGIVILASIAGVVFPRPDQFS